MDFTLAKNTRITERFRLEFRVDVFDSVQSRELRESELDGFGAGAFVPATNQTFTVITGGTRAPAGDAGSSRQFQLAMKLHF